MGEVWFSGTRASVSVTEIIDTATDQFTSTVVPVAVANGAGVDDGTYAYGVSAENLIRTRIFNMDQSTLSGLDFDFTMALGAGTDLWVPQRDLNTLALVDRSTFTLTNSYAIPRINYGGSGVAWDGATTLYLATLPPGASPPTRSALTVFDTATRTVTTTYTLSTALTLSRHPLFLNGSVYIHNQPTTNHQLLRVNPATGAITGTLGYGVEYTASRTIAAGGCIFTSGYNSRVDRIDPTSMTILNTYTVGSSSFAPAITTDGTSVWCSVSTSSTVTKIDGATGTTTSIVRPGVPTSAGGIVQWVSGNYGVSAAGWGIDTINW